MTDDNLIHTEELTFKTMTTVIKFCRVLYLESFRPGPIYFTANNLQLNVVFIAKLPQH